MLKDRLKELRNERDLLQKDIANILNITTSAYGFYEQGKRVPDADTVNLLAEYFDVSVDYLLGNTDIRETPDKLLKNAVGNGQIYFHRTDGYDEDLPDEAKKEIADFIKYVKHKYKK